MRNVYVKWQAVDQFSHQFGVSDVQAMAAVEEEMERRHGSNPWDVPCGGWRRLRRSEMVEQREREMRMVEVRKRAEEKKRLGEQKSEAKGEGYGEEQWDLFERALGCDDLESEGS